MLERGRRSGLGVLDGRRRWIGGAFGRCCTLVNLYLGLGIGVMAILVGKLVWKDRNFNR